MSIAKKISEVMEKVQYLQKDGTVEYGRTNYAYLSEEKITNSLNKAFREVGLIIYPSSMEVVSNTGNMAQIRATYKIQDTDSEEFIEVQTIGEGQDKGDKKMNKAMTAAFKYAQRQAFMIPTGDDPDHISSDEMNDKLAEEKAKKDAKVEAIREIYKENKETSKEVIFDFLTERGFDKDFKQMNELTLKQLASLIRQLNKEVK